MHDNTKALLATGIPIILLALLFGLIPRDILYVLDTIHCLNSSGSGWSLCVNAGTVKETVSVYAFVVLTVLAGFGVALGLVFAILNCLSCGASNCMKVAGRVFVGMGLTGLADSGVFAVCMLIVDQSGDQQTQANALIVGSYTGLQLFSFATAWLLLCIIGPWITSGDSCCMKFVLYAIGGAATFMMSAVLVGCDPGKVLKRLAELAAQASGDAPEESGGGLRFIGELLADGPSFDPSLAKAMGFVIGAADLVVYTLTFAFCFCGAAKRGCCGCCGRGGAGSGVA